MRVQELLSSLISAGELDLSLVSAVRWRRTAMATTLPPPRPPPSERTALLPLERSGTTVTAAATASAPASSSLLTLPYTHFLEVALTEVLLAGSIDEHGVLCAHLRSAAHAQRTRWRLRLAGVLALVLAPLAVTVGLALQGAAVLADVRASADARGPRRWSLRALRAIAAPGELPHALQRRLLPVSTRAERFLAAAAPPPSPLLTATATLVYVGAAAALAALLLLGALDEALLLAGGPTLAGASLLTCGAMAGAALAAARGAVLTGEAAAEHAAAADGCRRTPAGDGGSHGNNVGGDDDDAGVAGADYPADLPAARELLAQLTTDLDRLPGWPAARAGSGARLADIQSARAALRSAFPHRLALALIEALGGITTPIALIAVLPARVENIFAQLAEAAERAIPTPAPAHTPASATLVLLTADDAAQDGGAERPAASMAGRRLVWGGLAAAAVPPSHALAE